ncbi:MAG: tetratricopeptide repeat protein [Actinomycetota bacterium]|nr:tetratricopeptide repeat protein [Actinomycetota bacterium]
MSREDFRRAVTAEPIDLARACLLIGSEVEPDLDVAAGLAELQVLAGQVQAPDPADPEGTARALREVLTEFRGSAADYADPRSSLLHDVLRRRRGLPILLVVVWLEVARRAGLQAFPVGLPGYFLAGLGSPEGSHFLVDAFTGGTHVGPIPPGARPYEDGEVVLRVLNNIRALASTRPALVESSRTALWATELSLLLPRHPAELRRERGLLLVRVGRFAEGARDLEEFADAVSHVDDEAADSVRHEARMARSRLN